MFNVRILKYYLLYITGCFMTYFSQEYLELRHTSNLSHLPLYMQATLTCMAYLEVYQQPFLAFPKE